MLVLNNVNKIYKKTNRGISNISYCFEDKGFYFVYGKTGCGKSTLLNVIGGYDDYDSGEVLIDGKVLSSFNRKEIEALHSHYFGYITQEPNLFDQLTVKENLSLYKACNDDELDEIIQKLSLGSLLNHKACEISAGQRQRVSLARILVKKTKVILADEPTGNLDKKSSRIIMSLLKELSKDILVIVVSHNLKLVKEFAENIIPMVEGNMILDNQQKRINFCKNDSLIIPNKMSLDFKLILKKIVKNDFTQNMTFITIFGFCVTLLLWLFNFNNLDGVNIFDNAYKKLNITSFISTETFKDEDNRKSYNYFNGYDYYEDNYYKNDNIELSHFVYYQSFNGLEYNSKIYYCELNENLKLIKGQYSENQYDIYISNYLNSQLNNPSSLFINEQEYFVKGIYNCGLDYENILESLANQDDFEYIVNKIYTNDLENILGITKLNSYDFLRSSTTLYTKFANTLTYIVDASTKEMFIVNGRMPENENEVIINKKYFNELPINNDNYNAKSYSSFFNVRDSIYFKNLFSPYEFIDSDIKIVGIYDDGSTDFEIAFKHNSYEKLFDIYFNYFGSSSYILETSKQNINYIYSSEEFMIEAPFSSAIYRILEISENVTNMTYVMYALLLLFLFFFVLRHLYIQFKSKKKEIGVLTSLGISKRNVWFGFVLDNLQKSTITFVVSILFTYLFNILMDILFNKIFNFMGVDIKYLQMHFGFYLIVFVIVILINVLASLVELRKLKKNNILPWIKDNI